MSTRRLLSNSISDREMIEIFEFGLIWLNLWGSNPFIPITRKWTILYFVKGFAFGMCPTLLMLYAMHKKWEGVESAGNFADQFSTVYQVMWKVYVLGVQKSNIYNAYNMAQQFMCLNTTPGTRMDHVVKELRKKSSGLFKILGYSILVAGVSFLLKPLLYWQRVLPAVYGVGCNQDYFYCYVIDYAYQIFATFFIVTFAVGFDSIFCGFLALAYIELEVIKLQLIDLIDDDVIYEEEVYVKKMNLLVKQHNLVLTFVDKIQSIYQMVLLQQFASCVGAICFGLFVINLEPFPPRLPVLLKYVPFLLAYQVQLFFNCYAGELLMNQATGVADSAFQANWHLKHQPKVTKGLILIIQRANRPIVLRIGKMYDLNIETFTSVIKTAFSVCALMQTVYEVEN